MECLEWVSSRELPKVLMNIKDIKYRIGQIEATVDDPEEAHSFEDDLFVSVLKEIANGGNTLDECRNMARKALETLSIDFPRWCA